MQPDVLIVGAGVAGLSCARSLAEAGATVRVLEKSRGVGGRCATRRVEGQPVDHGACFYHGSDPDFLAALDAAGGPEETVEGWPRRVRGSGPPCQPRAFARGERRLAFRAGMTVFPKRLAKGLDVRRACRIRTVVLRGDRIELTDEDGSRHTAPAVVLALPAPQAQELMATSEEMRNDLAPLVTLVDGLASMCCLTVMAGYPADAPRPEWEMAYPESARVLQLISLDSSKRCNPQQRVLVMQALPGWSRKSWDLQESDWRVPMLEEAGSLCGTWAARPEWVATQRWRFARLAGTELTHPLLVTLGGGARLGICGEAFAPGGGVQGAWLSGRELGLRLTGDGTE